MEDKLKMMLKSTDEETYLLGMAILMKEEPAIYTALLNYTGYGKITETLLNTLSKKDLVNIGDSIKYKGLEGVPVMIVTGIKCEPMNRSIPAPASTNVTSSSTGATQIYAYLTKISAKYFNRSNQSFIVIEDRLECFEILNKEYGSRKES